MRTIFISHPFSSDPERSRVRVLAIARQLVSEGALPLAPQIYLPSCVEERAERDLALKLSLALVALADELRVYGGLSEGMRLEVAEARRTQRA